MKNNSEVLIWGFTPAQLLKGLGYVKDIFSSIEKTVVCQIDYSSNNSNKKLETNKLYISDNPCQASRQL